MHGFGACFGACFGVRPQLDVSQPDVPSVTGRTYRNDDCSARSKGCNGVATSDALPLPPAVPAGAGSESAAAPAESSGANQEMTITVPDSSPIGAAPQHVSLCSSRPDASARPELVSMLASANSFSKLMLHNPPLQLSKAVFHSPSLQLSNMDSTVSLGSGTIALISDVRVSLAGDNRVSDCGPVAVKLSTLEQMLTSVTEPLWVGQGAQGAVLRGMWRSGGCTVAVKWLVSNGGDMPAAYMEALLAKMLAHPFVVQTFEYGMCMLEDGFDRPPQPPPPSPPPLPPPQQPLSQQDEQQVGQELGKQQPLPQPLSPQQEHGELAGGSLLAPSTAGAPEGRSTGFAWSVGTGDCWTAGATLSASASELQCPAPLCQSSVPDSAAVLARGAEATGLQLDASASPEGPNTPHTPRQWTTGSMVPPSPFETAAATHDSFDGSCGIAGARPVDCAEVLKQLGAAPGKFVVQIVSEWCDEGTLHAAIRRGVFRPQAPGPGSGPGRSRTWALRALLRTAREVAQGMCHLHSLSIIHGDLKPANVLLKSSRIDTRGFVAKVADFGLSRLCSQREEFVATADWGTVPYMASEYLDNRLCKNSDVYSFGVLLWQMYTGKTPFAGHLEAQVAVGVMMGNLQLEWPTNMPVPLRRLGQACCRHDASQRPTFKEVAVALQGIETQVRDAHARIKMMARRCDTGAAASVSLASASSASATSAALPRPPGTASGLFQQQNHLAASNPQSQPQAGRLLGTVRPAVGSGTFRLQQPPQQHPYLHSHQHPQHQTFSHHQHHDHRHRSACASGGGSSPAPGLAPNRLLDVCQAPSGPTHSAMLLGSQNVCMLQDTTSVELATEVLQVSTAAAPPASFVSSAGAEALGAAAAAAAALTAAATPMLQPPQLQPLTLLQPQFSGRAMLGSTSRLQVRTSFADLAPPGPVVHDIGGGGSATPADGAASGDMQETGAPSGISSGVLVQKYAAAATPFPGAGAMASYPYSNSVVSAPGPVDFSPTSPAGGAAAWSAVCAETHAVAANGAQPGAGGVTSCDAIAACHANGALAAAVVGSEVRPPTCKRTAVADVVPVNLVAANTRSMGDSSTGLHYQGGSVATASAAASYMSFMAGCPACLANEIPHQQARPSHLPPPPLSPAAVYGDISSCSSSSEVRARATAPGATPRPAQLLSEMQRFGSLPAHLSEADGVSGSPDASPQGAWAVPQLAPLMYLQPHPPAPLPPQTQPCVLRPVQIGSVQVLSHQGEQASSTVQPGFAFSQVNGGGSGGGFDVYMDSRLAGAPRANGAFILGPTTPHKYGGRGGAVGSPTAAVAALHRRPRSALGFGGAAPAAAAAVCTTSGFAPCGTAGVLCGQEGLTAGGHRGSACGSVPYSHGGGGFPAETAAVAVGSPSVRLSMEDRAPVRFSSMMLIPLAPLQESPEGAGRSTDS